MGHCDGCGEHDGGPLRRQLRQQGGQQRRLPRRGAQHLELRQLLGQRVPACVPRDTLAACCPCLPPRHSRQSFKQSVCKYEQLSVGPEATRDKTCSHEALICVHKFRASLCNSAVSLAVTYDSAQAPQGKRIHGDRWASQLTCGRQRPWPRSAGNAGPNARSWLGPGSASPTQRTSPRAGHCTALHMSRQLSSASAVTDSPHHVLGLADTRQVADGQAAGNAHDNGEQRAGGSP